MQVLYALKQEGAISSMVMGVFLNTLGNTTAYGSPRSNIMLGGFDLNYTTSPESLFYIDLVPGLYSWTLPASNMYVGGVEVVKTQVNAVLDMTVKLLQLDSESYAQYQRNLQDAYYCLTGVYEQHFMLACSFSERHPNLPDAQFTIGGRNLTIPAKALWVYQRKVQDVNGVNSYYFMILIGENYNGNGWVIGNNLLRYYYTIYDMENLRVGFAPAIATNFSPSFLLSFLALLLPLS